jgi:tetratricopeptide (TPR) repeat protein
MPGSLLFLALAILAVGQGPDAAASANQATHASPDQKITFYRDKVESAPNLYPAWAMLGEAYLDRARDGRDPDDLDRARDALDRSLAIQPSFEALNARASLANFGHRFAEALTWADRAARSSPEDTGVVAVKVEALLGLGRDDEARALIPSSPSPPEDFHLAAALGACLVARGETDEAVRAFTQASKLAARQGAPALALWARVRSAGVLLDAGRPNDARPILEQAAQQAGPSGPDAFLKAHQAELLEADEKPIEALALYESMCESSNDPGPHARAWALAHHLGRDDQAQRHFEAAERELKRALDRGHVYPLEALATLYLDAGIRADEARDLASRNLQTKRDRSARDLAARAGLKVD